MGIMKINLTTKEINYIVDELCNANDAERDFINGEFCDLDTDELADMTKAIETRSIIIGKLTTPKRK
jgi:hypothetical protein